MGLPEMTDLSTSGSFFFFSFLRFSFLLFCGRTGAEASACAGRGYCGCKLTDFFSFLLFLSFFSFFSRLCFFLHRPSAWRWVWAHGNSGGVVITAGYHGGVATVSERVCRCGSAGVA